MLYLKDLKLTKYYLNTIIFRLLSSKHYNKKKIHNAKGIIDGYILIDLRDNEN